MGIVKISDQLHDQVRLSSAALGRSINAQAEHWLRVGQMAEHHPQLNYEGICALLLNWFLPESDAAKASHNG